MTNLHIPIYSMRSYETGKYDVTRDGNLQLHLARMQPGDYLVVPENSENVDVLIDSGLIKEEHILKMKYGMNAMATRRVFWSVNDGATNMNGQFLPTEKLLGFDSIVTDITGYRWEIPHYNNFNISKINSLPRPYIDPFVGLDIHSILSAQGTTVLNDCQREFFAKVINPVITNIIVDQRVFNPSVVAKLAGYDSIDDIEPIMLPANTIFFPFRISDKCYQFDYVQKFAKAYGHRIVVTDPNDSLPEDYDRDLIEKIKMTKREFYGVLKGKPYVIYMEDPNLVFHPGLAEFIYFGADIDSPYTMPSVDDILVKEGDKFYAA